MLALCVHAAYSEGLIQPQRRRDLRTTIRAIEELVRIGRLLGNGFRNPKRVEVGGSSRYSEDAITSAISSTSPLQGQQMRYARSMNVKCLWAIGAPQASVPKPDALLRRRAAPMLTSIGGTVCKSAREHRHWSPDGPRLLGSDK